MRPQPKVLAHERQLERIASRPVPKPAKPEHDRTLFRVYEADDGKFHGSYEEVKRRRATGRRAEQLEPLQ